MRRSRPDGGPPAAVEGNQSSRMMHTVDKPVPERSPRRRDGDDFVALIGPGGQDAGEPAPGPGVQKLLARAVAQDLLENHPLPAPDAPRWRRRPPKWLRSLKEGFQREAPLWVTPQPGRAQSPRHRLGR